MGSNRIGTELGTNFLFQFEAVIRRTDDKQLKYYNKR